MDITFLQLLKEVWADYRKRFFIYAGIIYAASVIFGLLSQIARERLVYLASFADQFTVYGWDVFFEQFMLVWPVLGGFFVTFWGFAALYFSFTGISAKEAAIISLKNLHRYVGMIFLASVITALGALLLLVLTLFFFFFIGVSPAVFLGTMLAKLGVWLTRAVFLVSIFPGIIITIMFSNAPLILLLEKTGIVGSLRVSVKRVKPFFYKTAFFLIPLFLALGAVYFVMLKVIFTLKLAYVPDMSLRIESMWRVFVYSIPWVLVSSFFDLFLYRLYLRIKEENTTAGEQEEVSPPYEKDEFVLPAFQKKTGFIEKIFLFLRRIFRSRLFAAVLVFVLIIAVVNLPNSAYAGGGGGGNKSIIMLVAMVIVAVVIAVICWGTCLPLLLGGLAQAVGVGGVVGGAAGAFGATVMTGVMIGGVFISVGTLTAISVTMTAVSIALSVGQFAGSVASCSGSYDLLFGTCTEKGTQGVYTSLKARFLEVAVSPAPTPEEFARNPYNNSNALVQIKWLSDAQPGLVNYIRMYDLTAQTYVGPSAFISGPQGNVCSTGNQDNVYSLSWGGKYRAEIWAALCFQIRGPLSGVTPICAGCGGDVKAVDTEFSIPRLPRVGVDISAPGADLTHGENYIGKPVELSWISVFATECDAAGNWSGSKPLNGTEIVTPVTGEEKYTLVCSQPNASNTPIAQTQEFSDSMDFTTTLFDFSSSTRPFKLKSYTVSYDWCWLNGNEQGCYTDVEDVLTGDSRLIFSAEQSDGGSGVPGPRCSNYYVGNPAAYDYCMAVYDSKLESRRFSVDWQGPTDRNVNDILRHSWLTKFTVSPQGIDVGFDSVEFVNKETTGVKIPPLKTTTTFGGPEITSFDVTPTSPTAPGEEIDISWSSIGAQYCTLNVN